MKQHDHTERTDRAGGPGTESAPRRTFVISDAHGYPELIENALEHADFRPGADDFVYAGDFVDRGADARGCLDLIERYATQVLLGNHEVAVLVGFPLFEQTPESRGFRQVLLDRVLARDPASAWKAVSVVDGLVLSHAGISETYQPVFEGACQADPSRLAAYLNRVFLAAVRRELTTGDWDDQGILGDDGPVWFRPRPYSNRLPLAGITQVVGHTPPLPELEAAGFYMVDPCAFAGLRDSRRYRYGVIEHGRVRVREGSLRLGSTIAVP
ncbi:MAG: metallophosphoesterase [Thermoleophilia bacterium]|nr:metallophosphoesterase [Thermoleophilia bacterium]